MAINNQTNLGIGDSEQIQEWLSGVTYQPSEEVSHDFNVYICLVCHVSGDFATDLGSAYWFLIGGVGAVETDPIFTASPASGITSGDITNWDTAFGWGDHATAGYLLAASATWAAILATGAESGANNPIINGGQYIGFRSGAFTNTLDTRTLTAGHTQSLQDRDGILAHTDQLGFSTVKQNGGGDVNAANRSILNFIEGTGMNVSAVDNAVSDRVDITYDFQGNLALVLNNGNSMANEGIIALPQNGSFEYIGTSATEIATSAMIQFLTPADAGTGVGLNDGLKLISGLGGQKATNVGKIEVNGEYINLDWNAFESAVFMDSTSGLFLASEVAIQLASHGTTNKNKVNILSGDFNGFKYTLDFGAIAANYTATWQQSSGTVAWTADIPTNAGDTIYTTDGTASNRTITIDDTVFTISGDGGDFTFNGSSGNLTIPNEMTAARYNASNGANNGYRFSGFADHKFHIQGVGNMFLTVDGNDLVRLRNRLGFRGMSINTGGAIPTATLDAQSVDNLSTSRILRGRNFAGVDAFVVYANSRIGINTSNAPTDLVMIDSQGTNNRGITVKNGNDIAGALGYTTASGGGGYLALRDTNNAARVLIKGGTTAGSAVFGINDGDYLFGIMTGTTPTEPFDARVNTALFRSASSGHRMTFRGTGGQSQVIIDANGGATSDAILTWQKGGINKYSAKYDASGDAFYIATGIAGNTGLSIDSSNNLGFGAVNANGSKVEVTGDAEIKGSANGIILESPDATRWRVTIDNTGTLITANA